MIVALFLARSDDQEGLRGEEVIIKVSLGQLYQLSNVRLPFVWYARRLSLLKAAG